jgi:hypothetical protein
MNARKNTENVFHEPAPMMSYLSFFLSSTRLLYTGMLHTTHTPVAPSSPESSLSFWPTALRHQPVGITSTFGAWHHLSPHSSVSHSSQ